MSDLVYNPLEDTDITIPVYNSMGKNLVIPVFICGVKIKNITSRSNESLTLAELEFEVHSSIEKLGTVQLFHEDENGQYNYRAPANSVDAKVFVGKRIKSGKRVNLWRNNTKGSGKMNKILIETFQTMGIDIKTKKIEHDGKKIDAPIIPNISEQELLGMPLFAWLDQESYTNKAGNLVVYSCINKVVKCEAFEKLDVLQNTLVDTTNNAAATGKDNPGSDPFGDLDSDLPF